MITRKQASELLGTLNAIIQKINDPDETRDVGLLVNALRAVTQNDSSQTFSLHGGGSNCQCASLY